MFTGIVQAIGNVTAVEKIGGDVRLRIAAGDLSLDRVRAGDSIAVNGVCLTAIDLGPQEFSRRRFPGNARGNHGSVS